MSLHFHAHQFNQPYNPEKLRNWEIPREFELTRPHARTGRTQIIANNRGHLLPGVPRPQRIGSGPWGHFVPTWRLPKKITRDIAVGLRDPKPKLLKTKPLTEERNEPEIRKEPEEVKPQTEEDPCKDKPDKVEHPYEKQYEEKDLSYVPGDLTEPKYRHENYALLRPKPQPTLESIRSSDMSSKHSASKCRGRSPKPNPFACVYQNFELAKRCAKENLEHHPLPDTVTDAMYKKLQMQRAKAPGLALPDEVRCTGIGWKGYGASGPTQCTKLRVYRPKTCAQKKHKDENQRPGSCGSFDMKWRFIKQKDVTPIELAICWDMTPENPKDEPKRTTHIDGSNGSAAPAVFQMVQSPKQPDVDTSRKSSISKQSCDGVHGCGTNKSSSTSSCRTGCKSTYLIRPKTSKQHNLDRRSISTNSLYVNMPQTRKVSNETIQTFDSAFNSDKNKLTRKDIHKSSPNLSSCSECSCCSKAIDQTRKFCRPCEACDKKCAVKNQNPPKSDYKMAFKAGKLQENKSIDGSSASGSKSSVKVPKQKDPYAKRNYDIHSLHPPFSIWKGTSCQSYPEHWRLASIYQHSYKPVENRKKTLLSSVYQ